MVAAERILVVESMSVVVLRGASHAFINLMGNGSRSGALSVPTLYDLISIHYAVYVAGAVKS